MTPTSGWGEPDAFGRRTTVELAEVLVTVGVAVAEAVGVGVVEGVGVGVLAWVAMPKSTTRIAFLPSTLTGIDTAVVSWWPAGGATVTVYCPAGKSSKLYPPFASVVSLRDP